jgi:SAM-dependent methyltransferase
MRTDILDLHDFYASPLGRAAAGFVDARLKEAWSDHKGLRIVGFGHAEPYLGGFDAAERVIALAPAGQGVIRWPPLVDGADDAPGNRAALVADYHWPLPDSSIDRLLIIHGLEEAGDPRRLVREAWRVLTNDGRLIIVAAHRRGLWSVVETTPFAAGRPYLRRQLQRLMTEAMFTPERWSASLFFPPIGSSVLLRAANAWERAGSRLWPVLGGVLMVEATKNLAQPIARPLRAVRALRARPALGVPAGARRDGDASIRSTE